MAKPLGWPDHVLPWNAFAGLSRSKLNNQQLTNIIISMLQAANINPDTYIKQDEEVDNEPLVENEPEDDGRMVEYPPEAFDVDGIIGAGNDIVVEVVEVAPEALERIVIVAGGIEEIVAGDNNNDDIENNVVLQEEVVEVAPEALEIIAIVAGGIEEMVAGDNNNGDIENNVVLQEKNLKDTGEQTKVREAMVEGDGNKNDSFEDLANDNVDNENDGREHSFVKKRKCGH